MKILNSILTLAIGLVAGIGLSIAVPVLAQAQKSSGYTQETYSAAGGNFRTTVVDDHKRGVTCYHSVYYGSSHRPTSSCVKVK